MRGLTIASTLLLCGLGTSPAWAQSQTLPNGAPLKTMERARSYSLVNQSHDTIKSAQVRMTNGHQRDLTWNEPVRPDQARSVAVPSQDCLAKVIVTMQSGRTLTTAATPDCRSTRIVVSDNLIEVTTNGSSASLSP